MNQGSDINDRDIFYYGVTFEGDGFNPSQVTIDPLEGVSYLRDYMVDRIRDKAITRPDYNIHRNK